MTNQNSEKSDGATCRPKDQEHQDSQPDYSAVLKDIELNLLRRLLKDGVGSGEDSNKGPNQTLQETNDRYRRYFLACVAVAFLAIGILSFIGYNKLEELKEGELQRREAISAMQERMGEIEDKIGAIEDKERIVGQCALNGTSSTGKFVFYPRGEPRGYQTDERVCALSITYPWACEKKSLGTCLGKKEGLSIAGFQHIVEFTIVDFFSPRDQNRMIQIPMRSVESLVGPCNVDKYIMKGVIDGKVVFPE